MATKPNVYTPGLIQIRARYTNEIDGDHTENVMWLFGSVTTGYSLAQLQAIQSVFDTQWGNLWKNNVGTSTASYIGSVITDWSSATGLSNDSTLTFTPVAGAFTGGQLPPQVSGLLSLKIAVRYRGGHGRVYLPYIDRSALTGVNQLSTTVLTGLNTSWPTYTAALNAISSANGGPLVPVIYKFRNDVTRAHVWIVTAMVPNALIATQRRRVRKVAHR